MATQDIMSSTVAHSSATGSTPTNPLNITAIMAAGAHTLASTQSAPPAMAVPPDPPPPDPGGEGEGTAAQKVFNVAELLEMILLDVPTFTNLFPLQRTNTFFRDIIRGSQKLRRRMFLEHEPLPVEYSRRNPVLESVFFRPRPQDSTVQQVHLCREYRSPRDHYSLHILDFDYLSDDVRKPQLIKDTLPDYCCGDILPFTITGRFPPDDMRRRRDRPRVLPPLHPNVDGKRLRPRVLPLHPDVDESWRKMLVVKTDSYFSMLETVCRTTSDDDEKTIEIAMAHMGDLFRLDDMVEWLKKRKSNPLSDMDKQRRVIPQWYCSIGEGRTRSKDKNHGADRRKLLFFEKVIPGRSGL